MIVSQAERLLLRLLERLFRRRRAPALPASAFRALAVDRSGYIASLRLLEDVSTGGLRLLAGSEIKLHPWDGAIEEATVGRAIEASGAQAASEGQLRLGFLDPARSREHAAHPLADLGDLRRVEAHQRRVEAVDQEPGAQRGRAERPLALAGDDPVDNREIPPGGPVAEPGRPLAPEGAP